MWNLHELCFHVNFTQILIIRNIISHDETDLEILGQILYKADIYANVEQRGLCTSYKNNSPSRIMTVQYFIID